MADFLSLSRTQALPGNVDRSRLETRENLDAAAAQFESIFASIMVKSMRSAGLGDGLLDSSASRTFRDRFDGEIAGLMGTRGALGIGRALADQLARGRPDLQAEPAGASNGKDVK